MLKEYERFVILDQASKKPAFFADVNWNENDEATNEGKVLKFIIGTGDDKKEFYIKREDLKNLLLYVGDSKVMMSLSPQNINRSREYETVVGITAKKDIRKGERIVVPISLRLPDIQDVALVEAMKRVALPTEVKKQMTENIKKNPNFYK